KYFGERDIKETTIIHFLSGVPGFQEEKEFVLLDIPGNELLQVLQSVQTADLAFIVANPHDFYNDYAFSLDDPILDALQINEEKEVVILSILTIQEPFNQSTINLKAPIIINADKKYGKQYIINEEAFSLKANISLPTNAEEREG